MCTHVWYEKRLSWFSLQVHCCTLGGSISSLSYACTSWGSSYFANATCLQSSLYSLEPGSQARFGLTLARWMVGNHLEKYIVPTSLVSPQVPAFVIIHKLVMLEYRKTARRHILTESYFSTFWLKTYAILPDIDSYTSMFGQ